MCSRTCCGCHWISSGSRHLGDVSSRLGSVQAIQKTLTTSFVEAVIDGLMALVTLWLMLVYSSRLALLTPARGGAVPVDPCAGVPPAARTQRRTAGRGPRGSSPICWNPCAACRA